MLKTPIVGNKIILRELKEEDAEFFAYWYNKPNVMFQCGFNEPTSVEAECSRICRPEESDEEWFAITDLNGTLIGETGFLRMWRHWLCTDMSMIIPDSTTQGLGFGLEAGQLMLNRAFSHHNMNRVAVGVVGLNTRAISYWKRLGFKQEGLQEQGYFYDGVFSDFVMMRALKNELYLL